MTFHFIVHSMERLVQGMYVSHYCGKGKSNALEVFSLPRSEHVMFFTWLSFTHNEVYHSITTSDGFTALGTRNKLDAIAQEYKVNVNPDSNVGWKTVPMVSNSVVLWTGPHRVTHSKYKGDKGSYRTVLYLHLQKQPPCEE